MSASPTSRTLELLRSEGWTAQVVERWNGYAKRRQDLAGAIDVLAWQALWQGGILGVQACAASSHAARVAKCLAEPKAKEWVMAGGRLEVWSWGKKGARGKRKTWEVRRQRLEQGDFPA